MKEPRSLFFPLAILAAGVIWLLVSLQVIPAANVWALTHLLPFFLMALGLGLILRSFWTPAWMVVSALVVVGAVLAIVYAPQLGWASAPAWSFGPDFGGGRAGSGQLETETREVNDFHAVSVRYPAEVTILQGGSPSVTIEAEDNLLPQLTTDVNGGTLTVHNDVRDWSERVHPTRPVKITITVTDLDDVDFSSAGRLVIEDLETDELEVSLSGAGDVTLTGLQADRLDCRLSGAGSIRADGTVDEVEMHITGFGSFYGEELVSRVADVRISGAGDATLRVEDQLNAEISGAGSIRYYGSPDVNQRVSGAGSVRRIGE
jgi:hypothetical protein